MVMAPFSEWPWKNLGSYKYVLYVPLVANALYFLLYEKDGQSYNWCLHVLILCALRGLVHQQWSSFSSMFFLTRRRTIIKQQADFKQIDKEWHWDDCLIPHAYLATWAHYIMPSLRDLPLWNLNGLLLALVLHICLSEPLYYLAHKKLHSGLLFAAYHSNHHSSAVPHSFTASHATPLEHLILNVVVGIPILGAVWMGFGSMSLIYVHLLTFDFLRCMGHSNVEVLAHKFFLALPFLKYLIYTSTYHSLHHREMKTNLCLFMPLFDKIGGTLNDKSWVLHAKISSGENSERAPDFVFLAHIVDFSSCPHVPFIYRSLASIPFATHLFYLPFWPVAWIILPLMWAFSKTFLLSSYKLRHHLQQTWVVPRFGLLYFLPFAKPGINYHIEQAILRADRLGVKVISLAALNKNEALNGGGTLFVKRNASLNVRVVHGNTLTAAAILHDIPKDCREVFLTGATSKLGRAIALYLCRLNVRVMMLTSSTERFQRIQKEAPSEFQHNLIHATKYQAAKKCKTWIVGKWLSIKDQRWAPRGTQFHQYVVPPITPYREDCGYGKLAAMKLPQDVEGLGTCEYKMERGVVHACHAGGLVHCLEGWTHHEVGAIDVDQIDVVWEAALKHGFRPVTSIPNEN